MAKDNLKKKLTVAPEITKIEATEDYKVSLEWTKVPLAEKYAIKRSISYDSDFELLGWSKETSYIDETAEKDVNYWYEIVAWKRMEAKKTSKTRSCHKLVVVSDIPCVTKLSSKVKNGNIHLKWNPVKATKYYIYRSCDFFSRKVLIGESQDNVYTDDTAVPGVIYHYCVQTVRAAGESELYGNFSKETHSVVLGATEILSAKATLGNKAVLDARVIAGADGYIFERSEKKDGDFVQVGKTDDITAVTFEEKLPSRFRTYYYRVCAYKKSGEKEFKGFYSPVKSVR